ncbi:MAG TPA: hemerythrin domain-containing protein [Methanomassiliicoccales archaeon]|nr:hemerythrin domain-containing protein [Methanomassiliicoccales archaeon]
MLVTVALLQYDHGLINQVIDVLGAVAKKRNAEKHLELTIEMVGFLDRFADGLHHAKEERYLFPAAVSSAAMSAEEMRELIADHEVARKLIRQMIEQLRKKDLDPFHDTAMNFVTMMQAHIRREEDTVFPGIEEKMKVELDTVVTKELEDFIAANFPADYYQVTEAFANWVQDKILGPGYFERRSL